MSINEIRNKYKINFSKGTRIKYQNKFGTIVGTHGMYVKIQLDNEENNDIYHPIWNIKYHPQDDPLLIQLNKLDDEQIEKIKTEISEYEDRMVTSEFAMEEMELLDYLEEIDP